MRTTLLCPLLLLLVHTATAQISWPEGQLLPSFPATAHQQDLYTLAEQSWRWEAEGPFISHHTGRLETDGWLCQTGIDEPNQHKAILAVLKCSLLSFLHLLGDKGE